MQTDHSTDLIVFGSLLNVHRLREFLLWGILWEVEFGTFSDQRISVILLPLLVPAHTFETSTGEAAEMLVLEVLSWSREAQVSLPVVERIAVDAVHQLALSGLQDETVHVFQSELAIAAGQEAYGAACARQEPLNGGEAVEVGVIDQGDFAL
jgi:hypothetical protein